MSKVVAYLSIALLLIVSLLAGSGTSRSIQEIQQPRNTETSTLVSAFSIVSDVRVAYLIHHARLIVVFVQPQSFTLTNITSYVQRLSEAYTSEEDLRVDFISDEELLPETLANLREMIRTFPFGDVLVPKFHCGSGPKPPLYAEYFRSS
jgi:hypothetical protein